MPKLINLNYGFDKKNNEYQGGQRSGNAGMSSSSNQNE